jgi:hypothetical protein
MFSPQRRLLHQSQQSGFTSEALHDSSLTSRPSPWSSNRLEVCAAGLCIRCGKESPLSSGGKTYLLLSTLLTLHFRMALAQICHNSSTINLLYFCVIGELLVNLGSSCTTSHALKRGVEGGPLVQHRRSSASNGFDFQP